MNLKLHLPSLDNCCCHQWTLAVAMEKQLQLPCQSNYSCHVIATAVAMEEQLRLPCRCKYSCHASKTAVATSGATAVAVLAQTANCHELTNHYYAYRVLRWW